MKKYFAISLLAGLVACTSPEKKEGSTAPLNNFCVAIHRNDTTSLSKELQPLAAQMVFKTGVFVLEDGGGSMVARAWLSEYAEKTIDIQYFIFSADNVGLIACDYLVRAADRGVKVRILVDDIMVEADEEKLLTLNSHPNIEIKIYNPIVNLGKTSIQKVESYAGNFRNANQRMHNKTFIVDGKVLITGGRNIADEYFDYDHEYNFRDRDVLLIGGVVTKVQLSFNEFWNSALSKVVTELVDTAKYKINKVNTFENLHQYACDSNNFWPQIRDKIKKVPLAFTILQKSGRLQWIDSVNFVSDAPGKNDGKQGLEGGGATTTALMNLVKNAKKSILIESPYLITTDLGKNLFADAVKRGVDVKIITNSLASTDNLEAFSGYQRDREKLLATGVKIFEFRPDAAERYKIMTGNLQKKLDFTPIFGLHAKSMVIDGIITVIGTFNLDPRSANLNTECVTIIYSDKITNEVGFFIAEELKPENSWQTTLKFNPDSKADFTKRVKVKTRRVVPKNIL